MKNGNDINRVLTRILSLKEWFWANGVNRRGEFELDPFLWVNCLYTSQNELELLLARKNSDHQPLFGGHLKQVSLH